MKRLIAVWILVTFGLIGGCSSTALLHNNAPWLVREQVDDYRQDFIQLSEQGTDKKIVEIER